MVKKFSNELTGSFTNAKDTAPIKGRLSISGFNSTLNTPLGLISQIPADTLPTEMSMSQFPSYLKKVIEKQMLLAVCMSQAAANSKNQKHCFHYVATTCTDMTEKNRHQHKYFPIINMCLFMFTYENSSGIT